jgi:hypothetical protein
MAEEEQYLVQAASPAVSQGLDHAEVYKILQQRHNGNKSQTIWRYNCIRYNVIIIVLACTCMSALYEI